MNTEQGPSDQISRYMWNEFKREQLRYKVIGALHGGRQQREHKGREDAVKKSMGLNDSLKAEKHQETTQIAHQGQPI